MTDKPERKYKEFLFENGERKRVADVFARELKANGHTPYVESIIDWGIPKNMGMGQIIGYSVRW